ncbi:trans-aconitate 2-methyltransferase [Methylopila jiangsuensis]|uniref:Trans-aconitate 2-methyltransferase n=1 Tax=Methylopila jiangsuensis TaxID=586230 RepID=A0A9W6N2D9_9HYPH|nr:trans-aconitate 2-methyltransferase [Methylopila jiangsuensis]MDR6285377.1 trans-aconitate 2-methyltransferase [Methylopila jiangsuensis]GLK75133.1 trans-aconitate 2-methyltransferase [Methylopila jiangsuensis]
MSANDWSAARYLRFEDERTRPAAELLARAPLASARLAVDLGCGPGNSTELLARRFPDAAIVGLDSSPDMLAAARARLPAARFVEGDIAAWAADAGERPDVIFANAALQWLPDHETLVPRLLSRLAPGGVLAVQMPDNLQEPSHAAMREIALDPRWRDRLAAAAGSRTPILAMERYYDLLAASGASADVWRTTFAHPLDDVEAIVDWLRATGLRPFLAPLDGPERVAFEAAYAQRLASFYAPRVDGKVLLRFPRLFMVAKAR